MELFKFQLLLHVCDVPTYKQIREELKSALQSNGTYTGPAIPANILFDRFEEGKIKGYYYLFNPECADEPTYKIGCELLHKHPHTYDICIGFSRDLCVATFSTDHILEKLRSFLKNISSNMTIIESVK